MDTNVSPWQVEYKDRAPTSYISVFSIRLVFSCVACVFRSFPVITCFSMDIHIRNHYHLSALFLSVGYRPPQCGQLTLFS